MVYTKVVALNVIKNLYLKYFCMRSFRDLNIHFHFSHVKIQVLNFSNDLLNFLNFSNGLRWRHALYQICSAEEL
jgi:hypothetical protein